MSEKLPPWPDGQATSSDDTDTDMLVSPKPIMKTEIKQAEILSAEQFVSSKRNHSTSSQDSTLRNESCLESPTKSIDSPTLDSPNGSTSGSAIQSDIYISPTSINHQDTAFRRMPHLTLQADGMAGVRFVLGSQTLTSPEQQKLLISTQAEKLARNIGIIPGLPRVADKRHIDAKVIDGELVAAVRPANLNLSNIQSVQPTSERSPSVRCEVLTNGSLLRHIQRSALAKQETQSPLLPPSPITLKEMITPNTLPPTLHGTSPDGSLQDKQMILESYRSNNNTPSSDSPLLANPSTLRYTEPEHVRTPVDDIENISIRGLVNPGFVFEFPAQENSSETVDGQIKSPSLLDVMHKKYWASNSPAGTLNLRRKAEEDESLSPKFKKSQFRSKHYSYCQMVDQNSDPDFSTQTLPATHLRMFGDVSNMFNTLPVRHETPKSAKKPSDHQNNMLTFDSIRLDLLKVPNPKSTLTQSMTPPNEATSPSIKLSRKFSLSPKVLRKKIIARLREYSPSSGSLENGSDTETDEAAPNATSTLASLSLKPITKKFSKDSGVKKRDLEIEAIDACNWLKESGFAQYVQLFDDGQFPVDLDAVERDHSFLDQDQLQVLFRRLNILNKSIHMKLDINNRKPYGGDEDEDDSGCVLSDKWHLERSSGRWNLVDKATPQSGNHQNGRMRSCSSRDSIMTDDTTEDEGSSPILPPRKGPGRDKSLMVHIPRHQASSDDSSTSPNSPKVITNNNHGEKKSSTRAVTFLQRVSSLRRPSAKHKQKNDSSRPLGVSTGITISGPTLLSSPDIEEKMQRLGCVDIGDAGHLNKLVRSASADETYYCDSYSIDSMLTEYILPDNYIPGTFPRELILSSRKNSISSSTNRTLTKNTPTSSDGEPSFLKRGGVRQNQATRMSVYDNVPVEKVPLPDLSQGSQGEVSSARKQLDAVLLDLLDNITTLSLEEGISNDLYPFKRPSVSDASSRLTIQDCLDEPMLDSAIVSPMSEDLSSFTDTSQPSHSSTTTTPIDTPELHRPNRLALSRNASGSHDELEEGNDVGGTEDLQETIWRARERRDSGVGSSLTREPLENRKKSKIRWHSFVASHRPSLNTDSQSLCSLPANYLSNLYCLSFLKITSLMESSNSSKSGLTKMVEGLKKKSSRTPDYSDRQVFGVPLSIIVQRTGQPLLQCVLHAMRYLRKSAADSVGIFRKSGVKSRIQKLRNDLEENPESYGQFETMQTYDVADLLKTYFRELPECLLTNGLSETFLAIYQRVPAEQKGLRIEALQACVIRLPDENREVLESLLYFLYDMASFHEQNQMTASNLAMCFAPSLFNIHNRGQTKSPKNDRKNTGIPDQREFLEQKSATDCLTDMIVNCKRVFTVSEDMASKISPSNYETAEPDPLSLLGTDGDYQAHVDSCIQGLLRESKEKGWRSKNLLTTPNTKNVDIYCKAVDDSIPLSLWKCQTEISATPDQIMNRILNERHKWDDDLTKWRSVEQLNESVDVYQYMCSSMPPQPAREFLVLRAWKKNLPKGSCAVVMHSIDYKADRLGESIRGVILALHYLIEPLGPKGCRVTHISRVDTRGRSPKWYSRTYGYIVLNQLVKLRDSFDVSSKNAHETKV